jgi:ribosomal protein S18 acetylase RimI-like enzyme
MERMAGARRVAAARGGRMAGACGSSPAARQDGLVTQEDDRNSAAADRDHVQVRRARLGDEPDIAALDAAAWSPESGFPSVIQAADGSFFSPDSPPDAHLVAEIDGRIAGYLRLKPMTRLPENAHVLGVFGLAVASAARRQGVAAALLTAAEDQARARGAAKLSLRVLSTNASAIRLYERQGFEHEGLLRGEFLIDGRYVDDVLMAKQIRPPG